jgi:hypothetical protein
MLTKTKITLAAVLILGTASAALAESDRDNGGYVLPGNMTGVNPVYHPDIFGNTNGDTTPAFRDELSQPRKKSHSR